MSAEEKKKLMLVDGHSILNRAFYGMPDLTNSKGVHTGAVYGFLNILFSQLDEEKPDYLVVAFDVHAPTFRHEAYAEYKGTRSAMPDELRQQVPLIKKMLTAMQIEICEQAGLEADDILGTLARKAEAMDMDVVLISGDRDLLQIATDRICIRIPRTRQGQTSIDDFRAPQVLESYGVTPLQFIDVKALMGDSSDNIPGVPKVGEKTATQLIKDYGSVDGVYQHLEEIKKPALHRNLAENEDKARLSLFLVTIKTDCDVELDLEKAAAGDYYTREAFELCTELGFKNFLPRFDRDVLEEKEETFSIVKITGADGLADLEKTLLDRISAESRFTVGIWPVLDRAGYGMEKKSMLSGAAVSYKEKTGVHNCFIAVEQGEFDQSAPWAGSNQSIDGSAVDTDASDAAESGGAAGSSTGSGGSGAEKSASGLTAADLIAFLKKIRIAVRQSASAAGESEGACLAVFAQKDQMGLWAVDSRGEFSDGVHMEGIMDLLVCCYLANPLKNDYEIEDAASEYLGLSLQSRKQLFGKKTWAEAAAEEPEAVYNYACRAADALRRLAPLVREKLTEQEMWDLYREIERPLTFILADMERLGIRIRPESLKEYSAQLGGSRGQEDQDRLFDRCRCSGEACSGLPGGK